MCSVGLKAWCFLGVGCGMNEDSDASGKKDGV